MTVPDWIESLRRALHDDPAPLAIGFSGGLDSTVLLHVLAQQPRARARGLRAVHVDHQLQPASGDWARHCEKACAALQVPFSALQVQVDRRGSVEAAARSARYRALAAALGVGEWLVLAHHRDDQVETLLLQLLRGAGPSALAGMRVLRPLAGADRIWRPLLDVPRATLEGYARQHGLQWIEDPSNADLRFNRNFIRHRLLPVLRQQWPQADHSIAASARLLAEDAALIEDLARRALAECRALDPRSLDIAALRRLPDALLRHVMRQWLRPLGVPSPPPSILARVRPELLDPGPDATPVLRWGQAALQRYRGLLVCRPIAAAEPVGDWCLDWDGRAPLLMPGAFGTLRLLPDGAPLPPMRVAARRGGERIALPRRPRRPLKHVLQELGVPPWERARLPLLFGAGDGTLLAAGDLAISAEFQYRLDAAGLTLRWDPADSD